MLGNWLIDRHLSPKTHTLKPDYVAHLGAIGFQADLLMDRWNENCTKLEQYDAKCGHCKVPVKYQAGPVLGTWVRGQRQSIKNHTLKFDHVACLAAIRQADQLVDQWNENYTKLKAYHAKYGHCNVPQGYQGDVALERWINNQRMSLKNNTLKLDRVACLNAISFQVDLLVDQWN